MRYFTARVLVSIPDHVYNEFSEHADVTFHLGKKLHSPFGGQWLFEHESCSPEAAADYKYCLITEEGGV